MKKKRACRPFALFIVLIFLFSSVAAAQTYDSAVFDNPEYRIKETNLPSGQAFEEMYLEEEEDVYDIDDVDNVLAPGGERIRKEVLFYQGSAVSDITIVEFEPDDYVFSMKEYTGFGVFGEMFEKFKTKFFSTEPHYSDDLIMITGSASKLDRLIELYRRGRRTRAELEEAYDESG
ncbi:hypothetical protein GF371_05255, partial [Candidatus Woesearchaeota archaeon]|nr:hypothetical protein [Candidatus Woesearchaeota archaeon]